MIISSDINTYANAPLYNYPAREETEAAPRGAQTSSKVVTEADGSTIMQYTSLSPSGAIMRKRVPLHRAEAFTEDSTNPQPLLRRRSDAYEGMMQIF